MLIAAIMEYRARFKDALRSSFRLHFHLLSGTGSSTHSIGVQEVETCTKMIVHAVDFLVWTLRAAEEPSLPCLGESVSTQPYRCLGVCGRTRVSVHAVKFRTTLRAAEHFLQASFARTAYVPTMACHGLRTTASCSFQSATVVWGLKSDIPLRLAIRYFSAVVCAPMGKAETQPCTSRSIYQPRISWVSVTLVA